MPSRDRLRLWVVLRLCNVLSEVALKIGGELRVRYHFQKHQKFETMISSNQTCLSCVQASCVQAKKWLWIVVSTQLNILLGGPRYIPTYSQDLDLQCEYQDSGYRSRRDRLR